MRRNAHGLIGGECDPAAKVQAEGHLPRASDDERSADKAKKALQAPREYVQDDKS